MLSQSNSWEINKACFLALPIFPSNWFWLWPHFFKHFSQEMQWGGGAKQNMAYASLGNCCMARPLGVTQLQRKVVASGECQPQLCPAPRQSEESSARTVGLHWEPTSETASEPWLPPGSQTLRGPVWPTDCFFRDPEPRAHLLMYGFWTVSSRGKTPVLWGLPVSPKTSQDHNKKYS